MNPNERLRILLRLERQRGMSFERAWPRCTKRIAAEQANAAAWLEIFNWSRDAWQRAYERKPRLTIDWLGEGLPVPEGFTLPSQGRMELVA